MASHACHGIRASRSPFSVQTKPPVSLPPGTWYPRLGSRALAKGALGIIQRAGGKVLLSTRALEILRDDSGAAIGVLAEDLASGQRRQFHAPVVISGLAES